MLRRRAQGPDVYLSLIRVPSSLEFHEMSSLNRLALGAAVAFGGLLVVAALRGVRTASGMQQVPAAPNGEPVAGISCDAMEGNRIHIHQHLVIFDHGKEVAIPPNVGQRPQKQCLYWLHTHTPDGIIHIEAPLNRTFTLGDFFKVWGQPLTKTSASTAHADKGTSLKVWVDGNPYTKDPATIPLASHTDIVIEAGPPFPKPPVFTNWHGA
jgi:hypothetical protein